MATPEETIETPETPSEAAGEWKVLYEQAQERITELEAAQEGLITLDDHKAQVSRLREKVDEEKQARELAETEAKENEFHAKIGVISIELDRERAVRAFKAYKGKTISNPKDQMKLKKLQESTDLKWLRDEADEYFELADEHKNTRAAEEERIPSQSKQVLKGVEANI